MVPAHFAERRLTVFPTAIGLLPPPFFPRAMRFAPKKIGRMRGGRLPERTTLTNSVSFFSNRIPASPLEAEIRSFSICGHIPVGAPAEPAGKDKIAVFTTFAVTVPDVLIGLLGVRGVVRRGCFWASCCRVSDVSGAMLSSEHTARTAPLTLPASIFLLTRKFRDDSRFLAGRLGPVSDIVVRPSEELKSVICFLTCAVRLYFFPPRVGCSRHCFGMVGRCSHLFASVGSRSSSVSNFWNNSAKDCRAPLGTLFRVGVRFLKKLVTSSLGTSWLSLSGLKFSGDSVVIRRFSSPRKASAAGKWTLPMLWIMDGA